MVLVVNIYTNDAVETTMEPNESFWSELSSWDSKRSSLDTKV